MMKGVPMFTVSHLLNHKTLSMVKRYAHLSPAYQEEVARTIGEVSEGWASALKWHQDGTGPKGVPSKLVDSRPRRRVGGQESRGLGRKLDERMNNNQLITPTRPSTVPRFIWLRMLHHFRL